MERRKAMELLENFPDLTPELEKQMKNGLEQYLLYDKRNGECYCTYCESKMRIPDDIGHRRLMICPNCAEAVTAINVKNRFTGCTKESEARFAVAAMLNDDYNKALKEKAEAIKEHQSEMKKLTADRDKQINELKKKQTDYEELEHRYKEISSRPAEISEEERNALIQQGRDEMCKEKDKDWGDLVEMAKKTTARNTEKKFNDEISSLKTLNEALRKEADSAKDKLEKLKAENTALQSTAQSTPAPASGTHDKISFYLAQIQTAFNAALEVVDGAEESEREALRNALSKALDVMEENIYAE